MASRQNLRKRCVATLWLGTILGVFGANAEEIDAARQYRLQVEKFWDQSKEVDRQTEQSAHQLERTERQADHAEQQLQKLDEQIQRQEKHLDRWDSILDRHEKLLDAMEARSGSS